MLELTDLLQWGHGSIWEYVVIFILAFGESLAFIGLIIPGSVAVIAGGFLAAQGWMHVTDLWLWATVGAILGDNFSFYLGQKGWIKFSDKNWLFKKSLLVQGKKYFRKHGAKSVFIGRFIGWVRPIVPFVAGVFSLPQRKFIWWNVASAALWAASHIIVGYFFGNAWKGISMWSTTISILIVIVGLGVAGYHGVRSLSR